MSTHGEIDPLSRWVLRMPTDMGETTMLKCGTYAGYARHRRAGEQACDECKAAANAYQKQRPSYCDQPATTVDHVLPLIRGGTSHEGNLTPSCRGCNSRKAGYMVVEWRTGRRCGQMSTAPQWPPTPPKRVPKPKPPRHCTRCNQVEMTGTTRLCVACKAERYAEFAVSMRNRYRDQHGIPRDAPLYRRENDQNTENAPIF